MHFTLVSKKIEKKREVCSFVVFVIVVSFVFVVVWV